jgi:hypothetical protein
MRFTEGLRNHAVHHAIGWYQFANAVLGAAIPNGSLYVVTGFDKSSVWGLSSWSKMGGSGSVLLKFSALGASAGGSLGYRWENHHSITPRTGGDDSGNEHRNQCVFLRGFRITVRSEILSKLLGLKATTTDVPEAKLRKSFFAGNRGIPYAHQSVARLHSPNSLESTGGMNDSLQEMFDNPVEVEDISGRAEVCRRLSGPLPDLSRHIAIPPLDDDQQLYA